MSSKIKRSGKEKEKEKEKKKKNKKIATLCIETGARSEGYMAKVFKSRFPKTTGWESQTLCSLNGWMGEV